MNESHRNFIDKIKHENKSFELEAKQLFIEMIELIEEKEKEWNLLHPSHRSCLDGGFNLKHIIHKYYQKLDELKKNITFNYKIQLTA